MYVDQEFPACVAFGAQSDPAWSTNIVASFSGREARNQNWTLARHYFDASPGIKTATDYAVVRQHFHTMRGRAKSFPFKDPLDFDVAQSQGVLITAESSPNNEFQLYRRYGTGDDAFNRKITRPKTGTLTVYRTRSATTTDATADATIDYTTGIVTMASHVAGDTYAWSGEFRVPCRYDIDRLPAVIIDRNPGEDGELYVQCNGVLLVEDKE